MNPTRDNRERLGAALAGWLEHQVQVALPADRRGLRARLAITPKVRAEVEAFLDQMGPKIAAEIAAEIPARSGPVGLGPAFSGRIEVLDNELACEGCGRFYPVAMVTFDKGEPKSAECERCAPELRARDPRSGR